MNEITDIELVEKLKQGEDSAYNELYRRYKVTLFYIAMRLTNNKGDAEDAVQETFLQVIRSIHQLNNPAYLRLWLHRIVAGKCKDIFRRNKTVPVDISDEKVCMHYVEERMEFNPEQNLRFTSDREVINHYINRLPYLQKEAILLAYFGQLSMQEIADILNESVGTVKSRIFLAKKTLRNSLSFYESREHTHIDFHNLSLEALITTSLLEGFQIVTHTSAVFSTVSLLSKFKSLFVSEVGKVSLCAIAIGVTGTSVAAYGYIQTQQNDKEMEQTFDLAQTSIMIEDKVIDSDEDAYFVLMNWAMNEKQLQLRDMSEFVTYRELYNYLKNHKGPYWETLVTSRYSEAIEEKLK